MIAHRNRLLMSGLLLLIALAGCGNRDDGTVLFAPAPAANVADAEVTGNVKSALMRSSNLKYFDISVVTHKGDVRLGGLVDTQDQIDEAVRAARSAPGSRSVLNQLGFRQ